MLRREELLVMCGKGVLLGGGSSSTRCWEPTQAGRDGDNNDEEEEEVPEGAFRRGQQQQRQLLKESQLRRGWGDGRGRRPGWYHRRRGRNPSFSRTPTRHHQHDYYYPPPMPPACKAWPRCYRPTRPRVLLSLRPVNMMGKRAPGMRAPRNTNQFLMQEKYQLMHLRSDSVGTESGSSDCEMDPLDMEAYLGVLENARGALMDCHEPPPPPPARPGSPRPTTQADLVAASQSPAAALRFFGGCVEAADVLQEESLQYFPSENDVIESEIFMERDFQEFCSRIIA